MHPLATDTATNQCDVIYPPGYIPGQTFPQSLYQVKGFPTRDPNTDKFKFENEHQYVYRMALCLSPDYVNGYFQNDKKRILEWLDEVETFLNTVYRRDIGVKFIINRDERLWLTSWPHKQNISDDVYFRVHNGTEIINNIIGAENYDVGLLIRHPIGGMSGQGYLAGVYLPQSKGNAFAQLEATTIAHETGHLFGASHPHERFDGQYTEPGGGQSIMSYGSPRDFFQHTFCHCHAE
ncbi:hypothetical protein EVA_19394 [gut metagenome]|uniref:Peptidase M12B domain-containing protein n=1 Tax=gut metagenome TaxID=749906 RepID=J9BY39_9ZZZZ